MVGKGKKIWSNGSIYEGDFVNGELEGSGRLVYHNGNVYSGEFKANQRHGQGELKDSRGLYIGEFKHHQQSGAKGTMEYCTGDRYNGEWYQGKRVGFGNGFFAKSGISYKGDWENDKPLCKLDSFIKLYNF